MKIINRLRSVAAIILFYTPARECVAIKRYDKASKLLSTYYKFMGTLKVYPEANILMALVELRLNNYHSSAKYATTAFEQLETGTWNYKQHNKSYLQYYCSNMIRFNYTNN